MKNFKNMVQIAGVMIGLMVGAGFASGREIASFFLSQGKGCFPGLLLTGVLFAFVGYGILEIIRKYKIKSYTDFLLYTMGKRFGLVMEWVSGTFLCILFFSMSAAAGATFQQAFGLPNFIGVICLFAACVIVFHFDTAGVVVINSLLSPCMIAMGAILGLAMVGSQVKDAFFQPSASVFPFSFFFSAILYVSYNCITTIAVLIPLRKLITSKNVSLGAAAIGGLSMGLFGLCIAWALSGAGKSVLRLEIPMLALAQGQSKVFALLYTILLFFAIFTTAVGNGFGALKWLESKAGGKKYWLQPLFFLAAGVSSCFGFTDIVEKWYTLFGYLGLWEIGIIFWYQWTGNVIRKEQVRGGRRKKN